MKRHKAGVIYRKNKKASKTFKCTCTVKNIKYLPEQNIDSLFTQDYLGSVLNKNNKNLGELNSQYQGKSLIFLKLCCYEYESAGKKY